MVSQLLLVQFFSSVFQYSLCRVVLMVLPCGLHQWCIDVVSVLALSSRFDGQRWHSKLLHLSHVSVLALSSRFDGRNYDARKEGSAFCFSTRSVESF